MKNASATVAAMSSTMLKRDADEEGGGGDGGGEGGGGSGGGGAKDVIVVGGTIADTVKPALVNLVVMSVASVTINFVSRLVVSENVVASTVNSTFKTESAAKSFLRVEATSVTDVIVIAVGSTDKYSPIPILKAVCLASSNSVEE